MRVPAGYRSLSRMASTYNGPWPARRIRDEFFAYFRNKDHTFVPSSSTIPYDDPTLLFANAGMNQVRLLFSSLLQVVLTRPSTSPSFSAPSIPTQSVASSGVRLTAKSASGLAENTMVLPLHIRNALTLTSF